MSLSTCSVCFHVSVIARPIVLAVNTICLSPLNEENSQPREPKCLFNRRADQGTCVFRRPWRHSIISLHTINPNSSTIILPQLNYDSEKRHIEP